MSVTTKSGATSDLWTIDPTSKAGRVTIYDASGRDLSGDSKATYSAATATFTPPATPTDFFIINGSATKTVRIISLLFTCTQTTAGINNFYLIKRTSANSGGTAVATTIVKNDSSDAAATAVCQHYTANPTTGSSSGFVKTLKLLTPAPASLVTGITYELIYQDTRGYPKPITLRGTAEGLAINFQGAALPTGMAGMAVSATWTEE